MTLTLVQKHPIKGSREFELNDDEIQYTIQSPFKTDSLSVSLDILESDPVRSGSMLSFISKVNKEPLVQLFLDKPNKEEFDEFVKQLEEQIIENDFSRLKVGRNGIRVDVASLTESINILKQYLDPTETASFQSALNELKTNPTDIQCQQNVADTFNALGFPQSQIITYAPYITYMFSGNSYIE